MFDFPHSTPMDFIVYRQEMMTLFGNHFSFGSQNSSSFDLQLAALDISFPFFHFSICTQKYHKFRCVRKNRKTMAKLLNTHRNIFIESKQCICDITIFLQAQIKLIADINDSITCFHLESEFGSWNDWQLTFFQLICFVLFHVQTIDHLNAHCVWALMYFIHFEAIYCLNNSQLRIEDGQLPPH